MTFFISTDTLQRDLYVSVILGALTAGVIGFLVYRFIYAPLRVRKSSGMVMLVASLGVLTSTTIIAILFSSQFQTYREMLAMSACSIYLAE